jgi:hypothetical protein
MKEFHLTPDDAPSEKARKKAAMLKRLGQEAEAQHELNIGTAPQAGPAKPPSAEKLAIRERRARLEHESWVKRYKGVR